MKISFKEFETMVLRLTWNKSKWIFIVGGLIVSIVSFLINYFSGDGLTFSIVSGILGAVIYVLLLRYAIRSMARKINRTNKVVYIEQEIYEDKIVEKTVMEDNTDSYGEYLYSDIVMVKEDKYNYYLYLNSNSALIVSKEKLEDVNAFKQIINNINKNNLEKRI